MGVVPDAKPKEAMGEFRPTPALKSVTLQKRDSSEWVMRSWTEASSDRLLAQIPIGI